MHDDMGAAAQKFARIGGDGNAHAGVLPENATQVEAGLAGIDVYRADDLEFGFLQHYPHHAHADGPKAVLNHPNPVSHGGLLESCNLIRAGTNRTAR